MKCLIDADVLRYEVGFCGEYVDEDGEPRIREFDFVEEQLLQRIREIEEDCWANEPSTFYLTNSESMNKVINRRRKREGLDPLPFVDNFRMEVAKAKPYKGNRKGEKPFHFDNLTAYMLDNLDVKVARGMEADDLITIDHLAAEPLTTIICTRDKDLRMTEGMQYGWPCGRQQQYGPTRVEPLGEISLTGTKLTGSGIKFFYSQLITGDTTDNIPGLPRGGPALAFKLLSGAESERDMFRAVAERYEAKFGDGWKEQLTEQAQLLWMVRELDDDGNPVMWTINEDWLDGND